MTGCQVFQENHAFRDRVRAQFFHPLCCNGHVVAGFSNAPRRRIFSRTYCQGRRHPFPLNAAERDQGLTRIANNWLDLSNTASATAGYWLDMPNVSFVRGL
jgi:hypothetical protein